MVFPEVSMDDMHMDVRDNIYSIDSGLAAADIYEYNNIIEYADYAEVQYFKRNTSIIYENQRDFGET